MIKAGQESDTHCHWALSRIFLFPAGTKVNERFILEFKLYLQVVLTIISKPVQDVAFLKYEILMVIILCATVLAL